MADPVVRLSAQEVRRRAETPSTSSSTVAQSVAATQTAVGGDSPQVSLSPPSGDGFASGAAPTVTAGTSGGGTAPAGDTASAVEQDGSEETTPEQTPSDEAATGEVAPEGEGAAEGEGAEEEAAEEEGAGEEGQGGEGAAPSVELRMPPPPSGLSEAEASRVQSVQSRATSAAETTADLPPAQDTVEGTREAVTQPEEETEARAQAGVVASLEEREDPSPEIEELCKAIRRSIRDKRPVSEDELVEADPEDMAQEAGDDLNENVEGEADRVQGQYDSMQETPSGEAPPPGGPVETPPESVDTPAVNATEATPDGVPAEDVSLDEDVEAQAQQMDEAGMTSEPAQLVQDGPIAAANDAHGELEETAKEAPGEVLARQDERLNAAREEMAALQAQAQETLASSRSDTAGRVGAQQFDMVGSEEEMRAAASQRAEAIFTQAQNDVNAQLDPLSDVAMGMWEAGVERASTEFRQSLDRVETWIDERYEGVGGAITQLGDAVFGMPAWVTREYDRAETKFGDDVCELIREISSEVNTVIANCERIIADARTDIDDLFNSLPDELQAWAETQKTQFGERLDQLEAQAHQARDDFNQNLQQRAVEAVEEVQAEVEALREKARGFIGQIAAAIGEFLENPTRAILNGLLTLVGIPPPRFWAVVEKIGQVISDIADDPLGFASNLLAALRQGFNKFFGNIGSHLLDGLLEWLFQGLGSVGVELPTDFSLKSIITFFLQLMGITWERIRRLLAKHIGEENVALIEKAYELISVLIEKGPEGIFEMIKDRLNPQEILKQVLDAAIDYLIEVLITRVTARVIALFNPAGAIVQAVEAIYRVLKWVFEKAAQIFSLVETVVNGMADIVAGNVGGLADAIEKSLAGLIAPVIDFFADYIGLGGLPDKIAEVIGSFQDWVEGILDKVIGFLAEKAKALLKRLGLGGDEEDSEEDSEEELDPSDHTSVATKIIQDLEKTDQDASETEAPSPAVVLERKKERARVLEERYSDVLESGVGVRIQFSSLDSEDDSELEFNVIIAPNTTKRPGKISLVDAGGQVVDEPNVSVNLPHLILEIPVVEKTKPGERTHRELRLTQSIQRHHYLHLRSGPADQNSLYVYSVPLGNLKSDGQDLAHQIQVAVVSSGDSEKAIRDYTAGGRRYRVDRLNHFFVIGGTEVVGGLSREQWLAARETRSVQEHVLDERVDGVRLRPQTILRVSHGNKYLGTPGEPGAVQVQFTQQMGQHINRSNNAYRGAPRADSMLVRVSGKPDLVRVLRIISQG